VIDRVAGAPVRVHFSPISRESSAVGEFGTSTVRFSPTISCVRRSGEKCTACGVHNVNVTNRDRCLLTLRTPAVLNVNRGLAGAIALTKRTPTEPASFNAAVGVRRARRRAVESIA
jgi:hypothetical protein